MDTVEYRKVLWKYLSEKHPDARIAWKGYGRTPWRYSTMKDYAKTRQDPGNFNHRDVLPEELVIDIDCTGEALSERITTTTRSLDGKGCTYSLWRTDGPQNGGAHIHSYWDIPDNVSDMTLLRSLIVKWLLDGHEESVDRQLFGRHLIRFEGGLYDKKPQYLAGHKTLILLKGEPLQKNTVPQAVWSEYSAQLLRWRLRSLRRHHDIPGARNLPKGVRFLLGPEFKKYSDGGKRALFVIASYHRHLDDNTLTTLLTDFARYNMKENPGDRAIAATIKSIRGHDGDFVGTRYVDTLLRSIGAYREVYGEEGH